MVKCKCSLPSKSHHLPQPETISCCSDNEKQLDVKWRPAGWAAQHQHYSKRLPWNVFPPDHSMPGPGPDGESTCMFVTKTDSSFICWGQLWLKNGTVYSFTSNSAGWEYLVTLLYHICCRLQNGWQFQFWLILSISHTKHSNERRGQWVNTECSCQGGFVPWLYSVGGSHKKFITHLVCQTLINILPPPLSNVWA